MLMYTKYNTIMTIGIYAENFSDEFTKEYYSKVLDIIKKYDTVLQIHGFYIDKELMLINYDLVISFDDNNPEETINKIKEETEALDSNYRIIINYDQDFSLS